MTTDAPSIASGTFYACYLFDVADTIDLTKLGSIAGESAERAPLRLRASPSPEHIQFKAPPLAANLASVTLGSRSATTRAKIYDYGVVSIRFAFPYAGPWSGFADLSIELRKGDELLTHARRLHQEIIRSCDFALDDPHEPILEDYFANAVERFEQPITAAALLADFRPALSRLLMAEPSDLSTEEQLEATRQHFSYLPDDLVIVQWDSAFIFDSPENAEVILDILEFANSQLAEFRTYDAQLDAELDAIYAMDLPRRRQWGPMRRRHAEERAEQLGYLLVDIRELSDRSSNALKIIGDAYYARVYRAIAARLGLDVWQRQIESKLNGVGEVYDHLINQAQAARGEFLELIVIVLIAIEIVVGLIGLHH